MAKRGMVVSPKAEKPLRAAAELAKWLRYAVSLFK
jgi:hypothetical protein